MPTAIEIEIKGLQELQAKTERMVQAIGGASMLRAMRDSTLLVERHAKLNAPVDTGRLRASILPEIRAGDNEIVGVVGSNVIYAPYQEFGTGVYAMYPTARSWKRGGVKPKKYLTRAFEDNQKAIVTRFQRAVDEVVEI